MALSIKYFMWRWQAHFRVVMEGIAKELFAKLDERLEPSVFLVGVLTDKRRTDRHFTCVEPEGDFWIHSDEFHGIAEDAEQLVSEYRGAEHQEGHAVQVAIRDAIRMRIATHPGIPEKRRVYVSIPSQVDDYLVCLVLMLRDDIASSYPELRRSRVFLHPDRSFPVPISLVDAAAHKFVGHVEEELRKDDPSMPFGADTDGMLRAAGAELARGMVWRMSDTSLVMGHGLFRDCSAISSMRYERAEGRGRILFAPEDHPQRSQVVKLREPVKLYEYRAARKLLQLAFDDISLMSQGSELTGLTDLALDSGGDETVFEVRIVAHHRWELWSYDRHLMTVRYGLPSLPTAAFNEARFRELIANKFPSTGTQEVDRLCKLVEQASSEAHGTMLVISADAKSEVERLSSQATAIEPRLLDDKLLNHLTPIDGAILIDSHGYCHAIGVILDGDATNRGDPARGARFNSAIRYVDSVKRKAPALAAVVSEDGGVDIVS
ncbi:MAG: hypothetical protein F4Y95_01895 [Chloroflexi bacterium]|nr:hypothetical protein [Chloroflexota bacterium]